MAAVAAGASATDTRLRNLRADMMAVAPDAIASAIKPITGKEPPVLAGIEAVSPNSIELLGYAAKGSSSSAPAGTLSVLAWLGPATSEVQVQSVSRSTPSP